MDDQDNNPGPTIKRGTGRPKKAFDKIAEGLHEVLEIAHAVEKRTHVTMKRDPAHHAAPHTANVHVDEVANWKPYGWELAD